MDTRQRVSTFMMLFILMELLPTVEGKSYFFKRYSYRKKKDDKAYRSKRIRCEETLGLCKGLRGVDHTKCVRQCISPVCYKDLYEADELEEGEIDVRLNSFKGCLSQESRR